MKTSHFTTRFLQAALAGIVLTVCANSAFAVGGGLPTGAFNGPSAGSFSVQTPTQTSTSASVTVTILTSPSLTPLPSGMQWRIGANQPWLNSKAVATITPHKLYTIEFKAANGYTTPAKQTTYLNPGVKTTLTGLYRKKP